MKPTYVTDAASFRETVRLGETRENKVLEFKQKYEASDRSRRELRKDVAALYNTFGGTILVGIEESNDIGYARALRLVDPNVQAMMEWADHTLGAKLYPTPDYSFAVVSLPDLAQHDILAINVRPVPDGLCALEIDDESLRFPVRSEDRVRYLRAPEVVKAMANASVRRIVIALNELAGPNQKVHLASPAYLVRPETDVEYYARLRNRFQITSWTGPNPPVPRQQVESKLHTLDVYFESYDERQLTLAIDRMMVAVPHSAVRDVWLQVGGGLGVMLDCDLLVSQDRAVGVTLRSR